MLVLEFTLRHQLQYQCLIMLGQCCLSRLLVSCNTRVFIYLVLDLRVSILILVFVDGPVTLGGYTSGPWSRV